MLAPGDLAPWFDGRTSSNPSFLFHNLAGRYVVLSFLGSSTFGPSRQLVEDVEREQKHFDVRNAVFCGVSVDPDDEKSGRLQQKFPGIFYFWDSDASVSRLFGAIGVDRQYAVHSLVLDPNLRVIAVIRGDMDNRQPIAQILQVLSALPQTIALDAFAPVLVLPGVLEPALCRTLIDAYDRHGGEDLGMVGEKDGKTVRMYDHGSKRRRDHTITEPALLSTLEDRLRRRVFPEIKKAFQFTSTHIERFIVGCYDAESGGFFRAHRDDQTRGSAHRRFAVSIGLDAEAYEGGDLRFPEFGYRTYRAPTGGAVVFSCTLVHEVRPITRGKRYAFLPFIYDDAAAKIREENLKYLGAGLT